MSCPITVVCVSYTYVGGCPLGAYNYVCVSYDCCNYLYLQYYISNSEFV